MSAWMDIVIGYVWMSFLFEFQTCHNEQPMYYSDGYYLMYEERAVYDEASDTKETLPFWIVNALNGDEEYAYCNKEYLADCTHGLWNKWIMSKSFIGYDIDENMAVKACSVEDSTDSGNKMILMVVLLVFLVVVVIVGCACFMYHRQMNTKVYEICR
eukprot:TRINITY_DN695_c0_g1_i1.p1 TRINITY_DN695_c0_g1~~TRINITY_DN695_c0_g1_i1.p1  ORF type:complete len:157 (+),score=49.35 TRINITY_DN695_c0_g1_i1:120-590(+)